MKSKAITLCWLSLSALAVLTADNLHASGAQSSPATLEKSQSPNGALTVSIVSSSTNAERKLALVSLETKAVLADEKGSVNDIVIFLVDT
jgi:hypothetical protein